MRSTTPSQASYFISRVGYGRKDELFLRLEVVEHRTRRRLRLLCNTTKRRLAEASCSEAGFRRGDQFASADLLDRRALRCRLDRGHAGLKDTTRQFFNRDQLTQRAAQVRSGQRAAVLPS